MTTELTKAAQQALEALEAVMRHVRREAPHLTGKLWGFADSSADALRHALTQRPAAQEVARFEAGCNVLEYLKQEGAPYRITSQMLIALHGDPEGRPAPQQATPASAPQSLLMRLAGIAAECSDPDTTDALDALIATTQQATPEPECARSHPHENMSATCELRTEIARLRNENTRLKAAAPEPVLTVEKEPDYWSNGHFYEGNKPYINPMKVWGLPIGTKLYTSPAPGVPDGWRIFRTHDGIDVHAPDGGVCYVEAKATAARRIPEEVLHALCSALLAAQAKGGAA